MILHSEETEAIIKKLDSVQVELLRLREQLLPEKEPTQEEKREIASGRRAFRRRQFVTLKEHMPVTVEVSSETRRLLEKLKKDMGLESYNDVIEKLVRKETKMPESLFGSCKGSKPFKREQEVERKLRPSDV